MQRYKIVIPVFIGTLIYSILTFCVGPKGIWPMNQLMLQKTSVSSNLAVLYTINQDLDARMQNLSADEDTISVYAHELGYVAEGERLIKLAGFSGGIDRNLVAGNAVSVKKPLYVSEWICKTAGLVSGILAFFLFSHFFLKKNKGHSKKCTDSADIPDRL